MDEAPKHEFEQWQGDELNCNCVCGDVSGYGHSTGKTQAKKKAADGADSATKDSDFMGSGEPVEFD